MARDCANGLSIRFGKTPSADVTMFGIRFTDKASKSLKKQKNKNQLRVSGRYPAKKTKATESKRFVDVLCPDDRFEFRRCNNITRWPQWICRARMTMSMSYSFRTHIMETKSIVVYHRPANTGILLHYRVLLFLQYSFDSLPSISGVERLSQN